MLAQCFVSKLLDFKKSSRVLLAFLVICLFNSVELLCQNEFENDVKSVIFFSINKLSGSYKNISENFQSNTPQTPIAGPPGNENVVQSPNRNRKPRFEGPPCNDTIVMPNFNPGPPGNE